MMNAPEPGFEHHHLAVKEPEVALRFTLLLPQVRIFSLQWTIASPLVGSHFSDSVYGLAKKCAELFSAAIGDVLCKAPLNATLF